MSEWDDIPVPTRGGSMLGAIVAKELREILPWGVAELAIVTALMISPLFGVIPMMLNPLGDSSGFVMESEAFLFCFPLAAIVIGLVQSVPESRGDRFGFLTHRPPSRSMLFAGKAIAGTTLYLVAAFVPFLAAVAWVAVPGHVAQPFDVRIAFPGVVDILCGLVYYCAALVIGMQEGHWYTRRALAIGLPILITSRIVVVDSFGEALLLEAAGLAVGMVAAWGTFVAGGRYEREGRVARAASIAAAASGAFCVLTFGGGLLAMLVWSPPKLTMAATAYYVSPTGTIVQSIQPRGGRGKTADSAAGEIRTNPIGLNRAGHYGLSHWEPGDRSGTGYRAPTLLVPLPVPHSPAFNQASWSYVPRLGLIAGYDRRTRRLAGWIGPDGFVGATAAQPRPFAGVLPPAFGYPYLLAFPLAVYRLDPDQLRPELLFTAPAGDTILGAAPSNADEAWRAYGEHAQFEAVATIHNVYVLGPHGETKLVVPRDTLTRGYGRAWVSRALGVPGAPTFVWYDGFGGTVSPSQAQTLPMRVTMVTVDSAGGATGVHPGHVEYITLPSSGAVVSEEAESGFGEWLPMIAGAVATPATMQLLPDGLTWATGHTPAEFTTTEGQRRHNITLALSVIAALFAACGCFALGRRSAFAPGPLWRWTAIGFALGPTGLLTMLALVDRPAREACPTCGRLRVVTHERCELCGAPFVTAAPDGTEIFEPSTLAAPG